MAVMPSFDLSTAEKKQLLGLARHSISYYLVESRLFQINVSDYSANLQQLAASFVTLHLHDELRGCIGTLEATRSMVEDVVYHSQGAAFHDTRFSPVTQSEMEDLKIEISLLTPPQQIDFFGLEQLVSQLRPGIDGLILQQGFHKATFLPSVWEQLPQPQQFVEQLLRKAGIEAPIDGELQAWRYTTLKFGEH